MGANSLLKLMLCPFLWYTSNVGWLVSFVCMTVCLLFAVSELSCQLHMYVRINMYIFHRIFHIQKSKMQTVMTDKICVNYVCCDE